MKAKRTSDAIPERDRPQRKPGKTRLDVLIVERGLAPSRERAQAILLAGNVLVNGQKMEKPGTQIASDARIEIIGEALPYVSRGGMKLQGALEDFQVSPQGKICLDVGSSTGGFTDCLLQNGAARVFAVDVSVDQLDWKLRQDIRVTAIERNARYLRAEDIPERPTVITMDVSFISVAKVLPCRRPGGGFRRRSSDPDQAAIRAGKRRDRQRRHRARRRAAPKSHRARAVRRSSLLPGTAGNQPQPPPRH